MDSDNAHIGPDAAVEVAQEKRICAAAITFKRPLMLEALLTSLSKLRKPEGTEISFLVIDNDARRSAAATVAAFAAAMEGSEVRYVVESESGIPFARNRALAEAQAMGVDYLAFLDDDETADPDWLAELFGAVRSRGLELVGGPVRCADWSEVERPGRWQRLILDGIRWRYLSKERSASRRYRQGAEGDIVIVTNNWLLDLAWQKRTGLRFDESLRETGGSDVLFYRMAKRLGVRSGWSATAIVRERVPPSRARFSYQFDRARHQSMASFRRNHPTVTLGAAAGAVASCILKGVGCVLCIVALPFAGGAALVQLARQSGWATGRLQALAGRKSSLYSTADGI
jgi:succinoglycan biosynthesis protein ExoM